jgi:carbon-monoxide dehydrogenase medium subunit
MPRTIAYHPATSVEEAVELLARDEGARVIAGGQSLMVLINLGLVRPSALVDVDRLPGLDTVEREAGALRVGALVRHAQMERHAGNLGGFAVLRRTASLIAFPAIRERGTFGGNLAHADPTGEWCVLARLLDAEVVAHGPRGRRVIPAGEFFRGPLTTALASDELLVAVDFRHEPGGADLHEVEARHPDFATIVAAAALDIEEGRIRRPRIALGGVAGEPLRLPEVETALEGADAAAPTFAEAGALSAGSVPLAAEEDGRRYARWTVAALVERALAGAAREAGA